jgi:hypothetical protein
MEKKRSKGVAFWAWLFIISAIMGLLPVINLKQQMELYGTGRLFFSLAISLAYLICGICLLKLNNSARKAAIILGSISIILIPFHLKLVQQGEEASSDKHYSKSKQMIVEQMKPEFQQKALKNLEETNKISKKSLPIVIMFTGISGLVFALIPIYFFTRPKVKEQFQEPE